MNIPIALITIYNLFMLTRKRFPIARLSRFLIYLGAVIPVGDYILRFAFGEIWFQINGFIFHSFIYQGLFWGLVAIFNWSYHHDIQKGLRMLLPLAGLGIYYVLALFSDECVLFFRPLSDTNVHFDLVSTGFLIPLSISIVFLIFRKWSDVSTGFASQVSIGVLLLVLTYSGVMKTQVKRRVAKQVDLAKVVSLTPINQAKTLWQVIIQNGMEYSGIEYHIFQGWQEDVIRKPVYQKQEESIAALLDPVVRRLYQHYFRAPVIKVDNANETIDVTITEFSPRREVFWIKKASITKNKSGQIIRYQIDYGTII